MVVISDATVLIALARTEYLWVLEKLWGSIVIPKAVYLETTKGLPGKTTINEAVQAGWIKVQKVQNRQMVRLLRSDLRGKGECECIILAGEIGAKAVLIDDKKARKIARQAGIEVIGTLGVLVMAVKENILQRDEAVKVVERLVKSDFRLSKTVVQTVIDLFNGNLSSKQRQFIGNTTQERPGAYKDPGLFINRPTGIARSAGRRRNYLIATDICNSLADIDGQLRRKIPGYCNKQYPFPIQKGYFMSLEGLRCFRDAKPFPGSARLLNSLAELFGGIVYVTTRPSEAEVITRKWLAKHGYPEGEIIFCKWHEKAEIYSSLKPHLIIEDDPRVLKEVVKLDFLVVVPQWPYNSHIKDDKIIPVGWAKRTDRKVVQWR